MRRKAARLIQALPDESGSMTLLSTGLILVALVVMLPMVWNLGAVHVVRRQSQNGSDAAAQAAAESVARRLNALSYDWWGCVPPELPRTIVGRYVSSIVTSAATSNAGAGAAVQYAASNHGTITRYSQHLHRMAADGVHAKLVDGVVIPPVHIDVGASAPVRGLIATSMYDLEGLPVPSGASAEVYLHRVRIWETPCPHNPTEAVARHYQFRWQIRLVKTGW